jgi:hypothetical protein
LFISLSRFQESTTSATSKILDRVDRVRAETENRLHDVISRFEADIRVALKRHEDHLRTVSNNDWLLFPQSLFNVSDAMLSASSRHAQRQAATDSVTSYPVFDFMTFLNVVEAESVGLWPDSFARRSVGYFLDSF